MALGLKRSFVPSRRELIEVKAVKIGRKEKADMLVMVLTAVPSLAKIKRSERRFLVVR